MQMSARSMSAGTSCRNSRRLQLTVGVKKTARDLARWALTFASSGPRLPHASAVSAATSQWA